MENGNIREPAVAGAFYPADPVALSKAIAQLFADAPKMQLDGRLVGIISPHAGYMYSGHVAAVGYKLLEGESFDTVAVISPSHTVYFDGVSAFPGDAYRTPLGDIEVDGELVDEISTDSKVTIKNEIGHSIVSSQGEHALEVQLPFLQIALKDFKLLPLVMGDQSYPVCENLAEDLYRVLKDRKALVVASTDLSHFHPSDRASRLDSIFIEQFEKYRPEGLAKLLGSRSCEACGGGGVIAAMLYAQKLGKPSAKMLKYADSGVVSGDHSSVVGYLSGAITLLED